jgi:hypothetical protein
MKRLTAVLLAACPAFAAADVYTHGGSPDAVPHDKYLRVVSEADSPVQQVYVKSKDGAYVAAATARRARTGRTSSRARSCSRARSARSSGRSPS